MSVDSNLVAKFNRLDPSTGDAADLYLATKCAVEAGMVSQPSTFITSARNKLIASNDAYQIAFLAKTLYILGVTGLNSELVTKLNSLDTSFSTSDLYLAAKCAVQAGMVDVPETFATNIRDRLNSATIDAYEIAFLARTLHVLGVTGLNSELVAKLNSLDSPSDDVSYLYLVAKYAVEAGMTSIPTSFANNVHNRILSITNANGIALLTKTLHVLNAWGTFA